MSKKELNRKDFMRLSAAGLGAAALPMLFTSLNANANLQAADKGKQANGLDDSPMPYPRTFSHIGVSVPNLEQAVKFYTEVLGWYLIMKPTQITEDKSPIGEMCTDVFGAGWGSFKIAHLSTGDRVGVELFEFKNQQNPKNNFEYWKTGIFHLCVQDPDVEGLADKIVAAGGKKRMKAPRYYYPGNNHTA